ncbi:unknown protein [Spodoptera frugiperda multiple nucleopolyhedrovirus]|uniref:ORF37-like protein n=1 Tax=Spodoptera frugiperda nuclear polyhedrosis virus TaxID=10455 RepID=Q6QNZ8_NPVSF|nr:hypothetical protein SFMNPV_gp036 [Spodoptera frugiperda multiple nucleopolyhedrovirus]AAS20464.1 ORF37-like protein [Spodoptera frugiperda multiple nucleopolyhedrovirus]ABM45746.1 unknown protein [Spodoptera frugiperda multiple nucleopolyhedrovirus]ACA02593.1 unknown [Spodoptera frugiperda multiple nucleopolyhedrovirus]ADV91267.1 hypothetical protein Sf36 [Spodoptera frugiperda multiple nucleopolyhedrovirus]AFH58986.1 hypothetical protein Sf36 [Spodoptera frugiperda multiple nucleopolyhedr
MDNVTEALLLAKQYEKRQLYTKSMACYNLAIHFLVLLKRKRLQEIVLRMIDDKILHCVRERKKINELNKQIILKKYILIDDNDVY